jgi:uroporphyrin-III C-methyltransferase
MVQNSDKPKPSDEERLAELENQLTQQAAAKTTEPPPKASAKAATTDPVGSSTDKTSKDSAAPFTQREAYQSATNKKTAKTGLLWFVSIINFLLVLTLAAGAYWLWLQWQGQRQQNTQLFNEQQQQFSQQQAKLAQASASNQLVENELLAQSQNAVNQVEQLATKLTSVEQQLALNQNNLAEIAGRRPADWLLAEADYLVSIAGRKLYLEHDEKTAIMMLQAAASRLEDLADPSLLPLREKLANDMQTLQQINPVSYTELALTLGGLIKQVDDLPLSYFKRPESAEPPSEVSASVEDWQTNLANNFKSFFDNFFSYKKITTEIKPFMSEQQQWLAKEQLKFALHAAQIAILQENVDLFQQSLLNAVALLTDNYDSQSSSVRKFHDSLYALYNTQTERKYPTQLSVTEALHELISQRLDRRFSNGAR